MQVDVEISEKLPYLLVDCALGNFGRAPLSLCLSLLHTQTYMKAQFISLQQG